MVPYEIYKLLHFAGIFSIFVAFGMASIIQGRSKAVSSLHGTGLLLSLVGGFGMLARLEISWPFPAWVLIKVVVWVILGGAVVLFKRQVLPARWGLALVLLLGVVSAYAAIYKPFLE